MHQRAARPSAQSKTDAEQSHQQLTLLVTSLYCLQVNTKIVLGQFIRIESFLPVMLIQFR